MWLIWNRGAQPFLPKGHTVIIIKGRRAKNILGRFGGLKNYAFKNAFSQ